ncbi:hypothetical protein ACMFMG_010215 [Clarireedia jacksonii]
MSPASSSLVSHPTDSKSESHPALSANHVQSPCQVSTEASTGSLTETAWRLDTNVVYTDVWACVEDKLAGRIEYLPRNKISAEDHNSIDYKKKYLMLKSNLTLRQVFIFVFETLEFLCREIFPSLIIMGSESLRFWDWDTFLIFLIAELWILQASGAFKEVDIYTKKTGGFVIPEIPKRQPDYFSAPGVREFVYGCNNTSARPYNLALGEDCGKEPWSILSLHTNRPLQRRGPPVIQEWRETSWGGLDAVLNEENVNNPCDGEENVMMKDNVDRDWTWVANRRRRAQRAADDEDRNRLFS